MEITFLGLGAMGSRMAGNLLRAGYPLTVYNRTPEKAAALLDAGAAWADSAAEAVRQAEVVITMLDRPEVVDAMAFGNAGFVDAMRPGMLWMDCSTVNPAFSRQAAAKALSRGRRFLEAPVAGSIVPAANRQLVFFAAGPAEDVEKARPLMNAMGKEVLHLGDFGMGSSYKMIYNLLIGEANLAFAEALSLGETMGFSRQFLLDHLLGSPVVAPSLFTKRDKIEQSEYTPEFPISLMRKDLHLITLTAYELGVPLPGGNLVKEVLGLAERAGLGEQDYSVLSDYFKNPGGKA